VFDVLSLRSFRLGVQVRTIQGRSTGVLYWYCEYTIGMNALPNFLRRCAFCIGVTMWPILVQVAWYIVRAVSYNAVHTHALKVPERIRRIENGSVCCIVRTWQHNVVTILVTSLLEHFSSVNHG
jgi:hypothetical protein